MTRNSNIDYTAAPTDFLYTRLDTIRGYLADIARLRSNLGFLPMLPASMVAVFTAERNAIKAELVRRGL